MMHYTTLEKLGVKVSKLSFGAMRLPCPIGIPIPTLFAAWNLQSMYQTGNWVSGEYLDYKAAEKCIACNKCITKCPQHIQIPTKLKELVASR